MDARCRAMAVVRVAALVASLQLRAATIKDSETTTHGADSSKCQLVDTYTYPGFKVVQFSLGVLSHYSYLLISGDQALVVDPAREVAPYLDRAKTENATIKGVFLTHSHADFVAGHTEIAAAVNCPIFMNAASKAGFSHQPVREGGTLEIGAALVRFLETPGHTPDGICACVFGQPRKDAPEAIFTGDTLFVGSVGRPDLMAASLPAAALASMLFDTWTKKLAVAGDSAIVLPAHGAGSLCGANLSDKPFSTIGVEKTSNPYLQYRARNDFIAAVLDGLPDAPQYFQYNAKLNQDGPPPVDWKSVLPPELPAEDNLTDPAKYHVVDIRSAGEYAAGHIPSSVNIGLRGRMESWIGTLVPWGAPLVLVGAKDEVTEAANRLPRIGCKAVGYVLFESWAKANKALRKNEVIKPRQLYELMQYGQAPLVVDVRLRSEWLGLRVGNVVNLPLSRLAELSGKLDPEQPVVTVCNSAYRSSLGIGVLERLGFKDVRSMEGGSEAWVGAGLPVFGAEAKTATPVVDVQPPRRVVPLPERVSAADLKRAIQDLPGSVEVVDIRPAAQFADYRVPGSRNIDIAELINNPVYLSGAGALVLVDRDGSVAMMVAGILSQKTQRTIKALYGGLEAYWAESELNGMGVGPAALGRDIPAKAEPAVPTPAVPSPGGVSPGGSQSTPPAAQPRKRSAGC